MRDGYDWMFFWLIAIAAWKLSSAVVDWIEELKEKKNSGPNGPFPPE